MAHWIIIPWAWQSALFCPASIPSREVIVATFVRMFPNAAKKASLLMGLWKPRLVQKVKMMKNAPASEKADDILEVR